MPESDIIDVVVSEKPMPLSGVKLISNGTPPVNDAPPQRNRGGRPKGATTRWDAPSMVSARLRRAEQAALNGQAVPDTDLFGKAEDFENETSTFADAGNSTADNSQNGFSDIPKPEPGTSSVNIDPAVHRKTAEMIWDCIVMMLMMFIGPFWAPRPVGNNIQKGEIPFDERNMVIEAWCKYLATLGMMVLSPFQELWFAMAMYAMPRILATVTVIKSWFKKKPKPAESAPPAGDARQAPKKTTETAAAPKPADEAMKGVALKLDTLGDE